MAVVNIRRDVDDKYYRYRMPLLQTKIEGRGNGIKTVVPNMSDIARALSRPPTYPTKFFGFELGAQTTLDEKNDRYIINGAHQADQLRTLLDDFIDKFVLCGDCKNPETELKVPKDGSKIIRDCKACGKRSPVNMAHKLTTYISKNPPPKKVKGAKGAGKSAGQSVQEGDGGGSDDELTAKINAEAASIPTAEQHAKSSAGDNEGWSVDTSEAAVKARVKALEGGLQSVSLGDDDDEDEGADSPYNQYGLWLLENHEASAADVYKKAQELGIEKKHKAVQVLVQGLFTANAEKEVTKYAPVLAKMITSEKHQKSLLGGVERLAGVQEPTLIPTGVPKLLMALYQIDVLDEEVVKDWGGKVSKKYVDKETSKKVRKSAKPFLDWLEEEDESDDEDEEEEEEEDEDEESSSAGEKKVNGNKAAVVKEEEENEEDYDDL
jgi:translation initiation factor 5